MTQYLKSTFSVHASGTDEYRDNWERTFGLARMREAIWKKIVECGARGIITFDAKFFAEFGSDADVLRCLRELADREKLIRQITYFCNDGHLAGTDMFVNARTICNFCGLVVNVSDPTTFTTSERYVLRV